VMEQGAEKVGVLGVEVLECWTGKEQGAGRPRKR